MPGQRLTELTKVRHPNEKYILLVTAWSTAKESSKGGKHITYMGIITIRHLEIMPEMRTKGPKQSILRTVDCGVLPQVPCSISTDEWAEEAVASFGSPSAWYGPWTTVLRSLLPVLPLAPALVTLSPLTFLPFLTVLFLSSSPSTASSCWWRFFLM